MRGILNAGPAIEPFLLRYITSNVLVSSLLSWRSPSFVRTLIVHDDAEKEGDDKLPC